MSRPVSVDPPGTDPIDGSALKILLFQIVLLIQYAKTPKHREMQSNYDLQPSFGLIASTVGIQSQENTCVDQNSSDEEDRESSPSFKSSSSRTKELESSETSSEWMFT